MQVFGCLMKNPLLFAQIDKYKFGINDFDNKFTKIIFSSLYNMFLDGARTITILDIDNYLNSYRDLKITFEENNGIQYIQDCEEISDLVNFDYYYTRVKKFSALRALQKDGFDISSFYCTDILNKNYSAIQERFDNLSISDIFSEIKKKLFSLEENYVTSSTSGSSKASEHMKELKEQYKQTPEIGRPLQGEIYNTVVRGARKGKYYLRSAPTGGGKTRLMAGDACNLAIPIYYDTKKYEWVDKGYCEKCLIITTELDKDEIQTLLMAYVSGVNEDHIINNEYGEGEYERVLQAVEYIQDLRKRANNTTYSEVTESWLTENASVSGSTASVAYGNILNERCRELYWEATRRTDLIRFGLFTSNSYTWAEKGGVISGVGVDNKYNLFPIPVSDISVNGNLHQNEGY